MITLEQAAYKIDASKDIVRDAFKGGLYEGLTRPLGIRHKEVLCRYGVELPDLPLLHEATWEFVLYTRGSRRRRGPWVPCSHVSHWLKQQVDIRVRGREREANPDIMTSLYQDLKTDERRLYAWLKCEYEYIEYSVLEDALWSFGCMAVEDVCDRKHMKISRPPTKRGQE